MTADHLLTLKHYCDNHHVSAMDEAKLKAEDKQFNEAIKARHGKNAKKPTEAEIEKEETKAKKNVNYDLVVPRCCRIVNQNLKDKKTKKDAETYINEAKENHKKELENHIKGKGTVGLVKLFSGYVGVGSGRQF
jgi:predicted KAP-like P-loop ATPase